VAYYEFRAALMVRNDEGLTKTYNRFHDPDNHEPDIADEQNRPRLTGHMASGIVPYGGGDRGA
jgi:hypothetical protein